VDQDHQLGDVVPVGGGDLRHDGNAAGVG
jgi:hypothetical protein